MASRDLYRRFVSLCQKWPKDETKYGRDYAEFFRQEFNRIFPRGELTEIKDVKAIDLKLDALEKIANNTHYNESPLNRSSASGMEGWACREAISTDGLKQIQEQEETKLIKKLKSSLNFKLSDIATGSGGTTNEPPPSKLPEPNSKK